MERLNDMNGSGRGLLGRLQDDRTARGQSTSHLAGWLAQREVPGREGGYRTYRLVVHDVLDTRAARNDPAIGAHGLTGIPFEELGASNHLRPCLGERFAVLEGDGVGNLVLTGTQQSGR